MATLSEINLSKMCGCIYRLSALFPYLSFLMTVSHYFYSYSLIVSLEVRVGPLVGWDIHTAG